MSRDAGAGRRRLPRWVKVVIALTVILGSAVAGWVQIRRYSPEGIRERIRELARDGMPVRYADIFGDPLPEDENGHALLLAAAERFAELERSTVLSGYGPEWRWTAEEIEIARRFVDATGPGIALLDQALARREIGADERFPEDRLQPDDGDVIARVQCVNRALSIRLTLRFHDATRPPPSCLDDARRLADVARRFRARSDMDHLVVQATSHMAMGWLRRYLLAWRGAPAAADAVEARLPPSVLQHYPAASGWASLQIIREVEAVLAAGESSGTPSSSTAAGKPEGLTGIWGMPGLHDALDRAASVRDAARLPPRARRAELVRAYDPGTRVFGERWTLTHLIPLAVLHERLARHDAARSVLQLLIAACRHRNTHGTWPTQVDDLAPWFADGLPVDPLTDGPFRVEAVEGGVRVRSTVAEDRGPWSEALGDESELREMGLDVTLTED